MPKGDADQARPCILLVEDEFLVGLLVQETLREFGFAPVGPYSTLASAREASRSHPIDAAVLDVNLNGEMVYPLAEELVTRGIPFVLLTGYGTADLPPALRAVPHLAKPCDLAALVKRLQSMIATARSRR